MCARNTAGESTSTSAPKPRNSRQARSTDSIGTTARIHPPASGTPVSARARAAAPDSRAAAAGASLTTASPRCRKARKLLQVPLPVPGQIEASGNRELLIKDAPLEDLVDPVGARPGTRHQVPPPRLQDQSVRFQPPVHVGGLLPPAVE